MPNPERTRHHDPEGELFRLLVENVRDYAIFVLDPDGRVISWNPGAERLLGYGEAEVLGRPCDLFFTPEDRAAGVPRQELEQALATGRGDDDRWHARKDGSRFFAGGTVTPLRDEGGGLRGFAKIMRDRTEWKRAADAARERERLAAFEAAVGRALTHGGDLRAALAGCVRAMVDHLDVALARVWTLGEQEGVLELRASAGLYTHTDGPHGRVLLGQYKIGRIAQEKKPHLTNAVAGDPQVHDQEWARREGLVAFAGYPLVVEGRVVGVVAAFARQSLTEATLGALAAVASEVALAVLRLRAEEALRASEERFRGLMEQAPFSVQVFDATGRTLRVNRAWEELWGITLDQIADYNVLEDPQLEAKGVLPYLRRAFAGEPVPIPAIAYDPNETIPDRTRHADPVRWVSAVAYPLKDAAGRVREVILVHEDVTDRTRAEDALRASEAQLRLVADRAPALIAHCDAEARYKFVNRAYAERFGLTPREVVGRRIPEVVGADAYEQFRRHVEAALRGEAVEFEAEVPYDRLGPRVVHAAYAPEFDEGGAVRGFVAVISDVTERARAERAVREADRRKDEFLALLGHELRNPLAPIKNAVAMLELRPGDPAAVGRARAILDRQTTQLTRLVDELLDSSRVARGKVRLTFARLDLAALVRTAVEDHRHEAASAGLSVESSGPSGPMWVGGDAARLTQVVTNLWGNAVKFTPAGGRIAVRLGVEGDTAVLAVSDTGVGVGAADLPALFEPFRQADADPARAKGGLGLGLAVVKGLVELHGGRVEAHSDGPGRGATFTVRLPLTVEAAPDAPTAARHERPADGRRVVVVEDLPDSAESLREVLELRGFVVSLAATGPEGVELCRRERPDAVVCDIGLPGMTGFEVARALRTDPATARAILVAVSGYAQDEDRRKAREAGFDALLAKPCDTDELARLLTGSAPLDDRPRGLRG